MSAPSPALLYQHLADDVARMIASGTLRPGDKLPSLREMRVRRQVSLSTVTEAFRVLEDRGLIEARPQSGFYVRSARQLAPLAPSTPLPVPAAVSVNKLLWRFMAINENTRPTFGNAVPAPSLFPTAQLQKLMADVVRRGESLFSDYGCTAGVPELRRQIARRALQWGGQLAAEDILVTCGGIEALSLCLRAVAQAGDVVAIESPSYFGLLQLLESHGIQALEIPTDPVTGLSIEALDLATRHGQVKACILVPNFSNPLGSLMPDTHKQRLVALLAQRGIPLIEDDIYGEFYFGHQRPLPAKAFDTTGNVLYCGSFTKIVAPGLRVGWVVGGRYQAKLEVLKYINTHNTSALLQQVLARFLENGGFDRHMRRLRKHCAEQVAQVMAAVLRDFPAGTQVTPPQGGYVLWVVLPAGVDGVALMEEAYLEGISFAPGALFSVSQDFSRCIRLSCGAPWTPELAAALKRIGELAQQQMRHRGVQLAAAVTAAH